MEGEDQAGGVKDGATSSPNRINVVVRCRPQSSTEQARDLTGIVRVMDQKLVILMDAGPSASNDYLRMDKSREKRYAFDQAFGPEVGNQEIFDATTRPLVGAVMQAYNASVFAYGSTGAGKTFTMIGTEQEPGVMLRTVKELFERAAEARAAGSDSGGTVAIRFSFIEIYNENLRDLLSHDGREGCLDLREDPNKGMCVSGVTETEAESVNEVMELLRLGNNNRTTEPTAMNVTSSRSHAVLQVSVEQRSAAAPRDSLLGKLSLIDLAGSERASQTDNRGARLLEGANINRSLLALGNCINALASGCSFVPYRDSKLTRLLKDSLGGNCRTVMITNISPSSISYEDTLNTLKYANRAKNIRVTQRQNIIRATDHVSQYENAIGNLRKEVDLLKAKLAKSEAPPIDESVNESDLKEASEKWKADVVRNLESRTQLQRSLIEVDRGLAQWRVERERAQQGMGRPGARSPGAGHTLEERQDYIAQIDESIKENLETRRSIEERMQKIKAEGKELQAQLPQRVVNADLRAFLELIQRVQVLEVERLEADHVWERQRAQLEERDQEIALLREQLRLRNGYLQSQQELLNGEEDQPSQVSLFGSTLAKPLQERGPLRVINAWAAPHRQEDREAEEAAHWDSRPLRERDSISPAPGAPAPKPRLDSKDPAAKDTMDWRNMEMPMAAQIRGVALIQPPGSLAHSRMGLKGLGLPSELRPSPLPVGPQGPQGPPQAQPRGSPRADERRYNRQGTGRAPSHGQVRRTPEHRAGTCPPPLERNHSRDMRQQARKNSLLEIDEATDVGARNRKLVSRPGPPRNPNADLRTQGLAPPVPRSDAQSAAVAGPYGPYAVSGAGSKAGTPSRQRMRARSEHSAAAVRLRNAARVVLQSPGR